MLRWPNRCVQLASTSRAPPSSLPACRYDSQGINFTVTSGTICPAYPVIESTGLFVKRVVTGRRPALDLFTSAARFTPRRGTWLIHLNQEGPVDRPVSTDRWGGGARREQMTHRYRKATRGNRRLKAHWDERSLSPLITKAVRRHRRDADQLESQTWTQTSPQSWLAACVMRPTKKKKKKDCPRLKEEVLTGSLRHRFWSRLPLGRNYDLWLFNVVISRSNHKNKWLKIEHF